MKTNLQVVVVDDCGFEDYPRYAHDGDAGMDLRITHETYLLPNERETVGTGIKVAIPNGYVGLVFPRSGLASRLGISLSNCVGVIDSGYRGEVGATLVNNSDHAVMLARGERVCQLVVMPYASCEVVRTAVLPESERGEGGFGSTGLR